MISWGSRRGRGPQRGGACKGCKEESIVIAEKRHWDPASDNKEAQVSSEKIVGYEKPPPD